MKKTLYLILVLSLSFLPLYAASAQKGASKKQHAVLYVKNNCPYCDVVFDYLKSINRTIPVKNVDEDSQALKELYTIGKKRMVPCLIINNQNAFYESSKIVEWMKQNRASLSKGKIKVSK